MKIALILLAVLVLPIVSAVSDTTPPSIVSFDFEPKVVDVSKSDQNITFTIRLKDDLAGMIDANHVMFSSPSGNQSLTFPVYHFSRVSGDNMDGTYVYKMRVSKYIESGKWHLHYFHLSDGVGNERWLNETEIEKLGFPTVIEVKNIEVKNAENFTPPTIATAVIPTAPIMAKKYETYENEYFKVEYPANWKATGNAGSTSFSDQNGSRVRFEFRLKNIEIGIQSSYTEFNRTGHLSEPMMHFMKTFQAKNVAGNASAGEYKKYEEEYCTVEYPAKLSTLSRSPYWFGIVDQGNPIAVNATFTYLLDHMDIDISPTYSELNKSGYLGEPWMHFLETFELKKTPKRG